jgi:hypothetical protein
MCLYLVLLHCRWQLVPLPVGLKVTLLIYAVQEDLLLLLLLLGLLMVGCQLQG